MASSDIDKHVPEAATSACSAGERETPMNICVGVDSTCERCLYAFTRALRMLKKNDRITVVHVSNPFKDPDERLPSNVRPENIESFYTTRLIASVSSSRWSFELIKKKSKDQLTHAALREYVNYSKNNVDMLVVGFTGRKGPKSDSSVAGSTVDQALRTAFLPVLICKRTSEDDQPAGSPFNWVVAIDGTKYSDASLTFTKRLAKKEDHITILHAEDESAQNAISKQFRAVNIRKCYEDCHKSDERLQYEQITTKRAHPVSDAICQYVHDQEVDILVAGAGHKEAFGSTAERVVRLAETDVLVYQNKGHYFGKS